MTDYQAILRKTVLDNPAFIKLTLAGKVRGDTDVPWRRIEVRPVELRGQRHLQFTFYDARQAHVRNARGAEAAAQLDEVLAIPFSNLHARTTEGDVQVQLSKKGRALVRRTEAEQPRARPDLSHDRPKEVPLPADAPNPFLQAVGIMTPQGTVRPRMRPKLAQINEFLKLLDHTGELDRLPTPVRLLDAGCGSAYLTFALYHYLNDVRGIPAEVVGIDVRDELVRKSAARSEGLGCGDALCFAPSAIIDYEPVVRPDVVLALHACDTATDEAIAQGVRWGARLIVCAPCCHHDLQTQLAPDVMRPLLRHGILRQRLGDLLTDAFRALILRILGYRTDVIEFVAAEHTDKNVMIRAVRATEPGDPQFVREYEALKAFWGVTPYLEGLLGERLTQVLQTGQTSA